MRIVNLSLWISNLMALISPDTWQKIERCNVLLVRGDGDCGYTYQGKGYAHLIDSIGDLCMNRGLISHTVSTPYSKLTGTNAYNSPVSYNRSALSITLIRSIVRLIRGHTNSVNWANKCLTHLWSRIFEKAKPHCVIGIQPSESLCRAGKIKGIPVYDLQHGMMNEEHPWYGEKYRVTTPSKDLPDGFLCWDEPSAATLRKWAPQRGIDVRVIGNPWFSRFLLKKPTDILVQETVARGRIFNNSHPIILVSLQYGLDIFYKDVRFNGVMVNALEKVIVETSDSYNWLLRLHPVQIRGWRKGLVQGYLTRTFGHLKSVEWRASSEYPLPVVLQQVDLHITDMSTVVVEAGWMGVYSALLNINIHPRGSLASICAHERSLHIAEVLTQDTNIIKEWIKNTLGKGRCNSTLKDTSTALDAFIDEIASDYSGKVDPKN